MSSWKKHFKPVNSVLPKQDKSGGYGTTMNRFNNWLPEIYMGPADRLQRYIQYEQMDMDHEVSAALDCLAEFCTQTTFNNHTPFKFEFNESPSPAEMQILDRSLKQWVNINEFNRRMFKIFRSTLMYGDQFMIRDPETYKLFWVDPHKVEKVVVNEGKGKTIETYYVKDLDLNQQNLVASNMTSSGSTPPNAVLALSQGGYGSQVPYNNGSYTSQATGASVPVEAANMVHISLSEGLDMAWPFGISVLEPIFKVFKQKTLLEDAMLIYRIHRAPERRVFKIDVGNMIPAKAQQYLERVRYEVQQKRIPNKNGSGSNVADAAYNPMCLVLDTKIPLLDGRTLELADLIEEYESGKENWAYSCDPITGKIVPGVITWAGITRVNAKVIKLTFDNGKTLTVTPDHKIPVLGKGFVEAKDLTIDDCLIGFSENSDSGKPRVYDSSIGEWVYTHKMVGEFFKSIGKHKILRFDESFYNSEVQVIRHADGNVLNNDPRNIQWMNSIDCQLLTMLEAGHSPYHDFALNMAAAEAINEFAANYVGDKVNIKLLSIEEIPETTTTGTITIDGKERFHGYHTFATDSGIFVKNSTLEDYFFAVTEGGRGSSVETLPGGDGLGEIHDMLYFSNKMFRALGIPSSYLPTGPQDGSASAGDGKVGSAFIQEYRFTEKCKRHQRQIISVLDEEFKKFLKFRGVTIDESMFSLAFNEPQNFAEYKQIELDAARTSVYNSVSDIPFISKQYGLKRYLGWTEEDILENERLWKQESGNNAPAAGGQSGGAGLSQVGVSGADFEDFGDEDFGDEDFGDEAEADVGDAGDIEVSDSDVENFGKE